MREDESQILIPPSFQALYTNARGRLTEPVVTLRERYDQCEDLAQQLIEHAQAVHFDQGVSEDLFLQRIHAGLLATDSGVRADEAVWVVTRLAELLRWNLGVASK